MYYNRHGLFLYISYVIQVFEHIFCNCKKGIFAIILNRDKKIQWQTKYKTSDQWETARPVEPDKRNTTPCA